jgi:aspartate/methionine/tyrosine aminotransferase
VEALVQCAGHHDYLPTAGLPELRKAIADYYRLHFGLDCVPGEVVVSPGSKQMISMILAVLQGVVLIPVPSWVSYLPQAEILRKQVIILRTRQEDRFKLTPELLLRQIQGLGTEQKILIFNQPHNPTGVLYGKDELAALAEVCRQHRVVVVADEIYARTSFARGDDRNWRAFERPLLRRLPSRCWYLSRKPEGAGQERAQSGWVNLLLRGRPHTTRCTGCLLGGR